MVLLVVDTQNGITDNRLYEFEKVKRNIKLLIETARQNAANILIPMLIEMGFKEENIKITFSQGIPLLLILNVDRLRNKL